MRKILIGQVTCALVYKGLYDLVEIYFVNNNCYYFITFLSNKKLKILKFRV